MNGQRDDLVRELSSPAAFPGEIESVRHIQTHISHLFFAGGRVYKVKKAVDFGFLDFTSLEARLYFCEEEVRLNRRTAEGVYLGVVPIGVGEDGHLRVGEEREVVDYAVAMRELPGDRMLDRLLDAGDVDNQKVRDLAGMLVDFHAAAPTGPGVDEFGSIETIRGNCLENFEQTEVFTTGAATISRKLHRHLKGRALAFLGDHAALFQKRVRDGRIRDGHGDLHSGNICLLPDRVVAYDCIEFAERFRCCDVVADIAFLMMDMDLRCFRAFSKYLLHEYAARSDDPEMTQLAGFYKSYRAFVRFKVESMGLADLEGAEFERAREHAMGYAHLAASYELPPALVLLCGLPGTGKRTAAQVLARPFEAVVLNSDATRKRLAGVPATSRVGGEVDLYASAKTADTYEELLRSAERKLRSGRTVLVDAGFRRRTQRESFRALAAAQGVPFLLVHFDIPADVVLPRLSARELEGKSTSDAGVEVYKVLADQFEPPTELDDSEVLRHVGGSWSADLTAAVIDRFVDSAAQPS